MARTAESDDGGAITMAANNSTRLLPARNEERIITLQREMKDMRGKVRTLDNRLDGLDRREAERKGQITVYAAIGAIVGTGLVQIVVRMIFGA